MPNEETGWFSWLDILRLLAVPALVLLNAFFVVAEFSLVAARPTRVEQWIKEGRRGARSLGRQMHALDDAIAACQLGITLASLLLGWIGEQAIAHLLTPLFSFLTGGWHLAAVHTAATTLALILITILHVVLGEQTPKLMALQRPEALGLLIAWPLALFTRCTRPLVIAMNAMSNAICKCVGLNVLDGEHRVHSVEELAMLVEEVEEAGLISSDQAEYVHNVFRLSAKKVSECMLPREKMASLELHLPLEQVLEKVRAGAHTRLPVYDTDINNIIGIVNTKDLLHLVSLQGMAILDDAIYPATFLRPEQSIGDALRVFRKSHRPMAIVRNDAQQVLGLITLEDILEEIVGDIQDEHDLPRQPKMRLRRHPAWGFGKVVPPVGKSGLPKS
jgi:CBS domain containing-hemolysin-like protein